jgi:hypothetical protein
MNDDQIEGLLRRVRPAGPPPELRARILLAQPARRAWPWAAAAAALLLMIAGLQWSAGELRHEIRPATLEAGADDPESRALAEAFSLKEDEIRAMELKREFDRIMAADAAQEQGRQ